MTTKSLIGIAFFAAGLVSGAAQAALIDRGGGLIYDTDLNVTWLQNANAALGTSYDTADGITDGRMTWLNAVNWAANLSYYDSVRNVTYDDWRLPTSTDTAINTSLCIYTYVGGDCGYNVNPASSEIAHLYFTELGNLSTYTTTGASSGAYAGGANPNSTLDNVGPFTQFQSDYYWSGTEYSPFPMLFAWSFTTEHGFQGVYDKTASLFALAVRPGDVAAVPEAQTYAMLLAGLGLVSVTARLRSNRRGRDYVACID